MVGLDAAGRQFPDLVEFSISEMFCYTKDYKQSSLIEGQNAGEGKLCLMAMRL